MPLNIDFQQIFLHLLNFTILFAALDLLLYRPVKAFMDARAAGYAEKDRQARETLEEAERVKADYERKLAEASGEIRRQKEQAQQASLAAAEEQRRQAEAEVAHLLAQARTEARLEKEHILQEARGEIEEMVATAAEKLILANTSAAYDQFLDAAGKEDGNARETC